MLCLCYVYAMLFSLPPSYTSNYITVIPYPYTHPSIRPSIRLARLLDCFDSADAFVRFLFRLSVDGCFFELYIVISSHAISFEFFIFPLR